MLKSLGKRMVGPNQPPIEMATVSELLDIQVERVIVAPPNILEEAETGIVFEAESEIMNVT